MLAAHRKLDNFVAIIDNNGLQIDGAIDEVCSPYPIDEKFEAFGFHVITVDGHDFDALKAAFDEAKATKGKPTAIITKTVKDYGFAERYSLAKSKGVGTLSYIMRESEEVDRDDEKINIYDVETSKSMQLASDISAESFFKQIALNAGDYKDIVTKQKKLIKELTDENKKLKEENRLIYEQITKEELLKELAKKLEGKGLGRREIQDMVLAEIHYDDNEIKEMKKRGKKK